jgi:hypothetical protein
LPIFLPVLNYIVKVIPDTGGGGGGGGGATTCGGLIDAGTACIANTGTSGHTLPFLDGINTFSNRMNTFASSTSTAGLNIAPGVAPTSPVNGDMWVTSAGIFVQINGGTVGPLGAGGGGSGIVIGTTTVSGGTSGRVLYNNGSVAGEYPITGTAGNVVMSVSPTITGHPTVEGITSTGATGTAKFVFSTSPSIASPTITGSFTATGLH